MSKCRAGLCPSISASGSRRRWRRTPTRCRWTPVGPLALKAQGRKAECIWVPGPGSINFSIQGSVSQVRGWWRKGCGGGGEGCELPASDARGCQLLPFSSSLFPRFSLPLSLHINLSVSFFCLDICAPVFFCASTLHLPTACRNCTSPSISVCVLGRGGCVGGQFSFRLPLWCCRFHTSPKGPLPSSVDACSCVCFCIFLFFMSFFAFISL